MELSDLSTAARVLMSFSEMQCTKVQTRSRISESIFSVFNPKYLNELAAVYLTFGFLEERLAITNAFISLRFNQATRPRNKKILDLELIEKRLHLK